GIFAEICRGLNQIGEATDASISEMNAALRHLAKGDLWGKIAAGEDLMRLRPATGAWVSSPNRTFPTRRLCTQRLARAF
ncbi:hypothetical protein, partial [Rhodobacter aestuarii]|uniref:hypothetical protein n=1 Tax=Rhodobacter aestuarii TaxID=453582 RepID=UPI001C378F0E